MSFKFNWDFFDVEDLRARCREALTESIAQTRRPAAIAAPVRAVDVDFGTQPPELTFESIPTIGVRRTHVVFALRYSGDASLTLATEVQANVLCEPLSDAALPLFVRPRVIAALDGLRLPFSLTLRRVVLDTLVDVVYTPHGVAVHFRDDPVKSIAVESSLDALPLARDTVAALLRSQLNASFAEDLPESVWASTNPARRPPDPHYGARRWARHADRFTKLAAYLFSPVVSPAIVAAATAKRPFHTLALNARGTRALAMPRAILSRACLSRLSAAHAPAARDAAASSAAHHGLKGGAPPPPSPALAPGHATEKLKLDAYLTAVAPASGPGQGAGQGAGLSPVTSARSFSGHSYGSTVSISSGSDSASVPAFKPRRRVIRLRNSSAHSSGHTLAAATAAATAATASAAAATATAAAASPPTETAAAAPTADTAATETETTLRTPSPPQSPTTLASPYSAASVPSPAPPSSRVPAARPGAAAEGQKASSASSSVASSAVASPAVAAVASPLVVAADVADPRVPPAYSRTRPRARHASAPVHRNSRSRSSRPVPSQRGGGSTLPHTPAFTPSTEYAMLSDDDEFEDAPMLPPALGWAAPPRFSTPEEAEPVLKNRPFNRQASPVRRRASGTGLPLAGEPATPLRSPKGRSSSRSSSRYASTNDLMMKEQLKEAREHFFDAQAD